ncbi:hypothetical protein RKAS3_01070 [Rhodoluna sp. KAS3]|nr:hypothetical protein RKAS3_01070 [Rhodoluna sp. KAS3]
MTMLLDSHVLLWFSAGSSKLGKNARRRIERAHQLHYSSLSALELGIKSIEGKLNLPKNYFASLKAAGFLEVQFDSDHATELTTMQGLIGHDPIDRGIVATAISTNMPLITADRRILALNLPFVFDAQD